MEAGFIRFDPASEFEILETIDFEEEIQRPESLRFFTLDEQLLDYFDKVIPKTGKVTKFEYRRISTQVDRLRDIYNRLISVTDTDYTVDFSRKKVDVGWVKPIYADFELASYSYAEQFNPLYSDSLRRTPNYYPRMLAALPKPYKLTGAQGVPFVGTATLVDDDGNNPINVLGTYERTRGVIHEDGSFTVIKLPVGNTADEMKVKGFYIQKRPVEIPNPLAEHPFLASNEPHRYLTDEPLNRVFPTIEAILTHGVPTTNDPYGEGKKFLKIYDVSLSQISWDLWKEKFPPVGIITSTPSVLSIAFPRSEDIVAPSKTLQDIYVVKWYPGIEPREWLSRQEDGGSLVSKMLLTKAGKSGLLPPAMLAEKPVSQPILSTPEECFTFDTFDGLMGAGVYRLPKWADVNAAIDKGKPIPSGTCVPMPQVVQEKSDIISEGKTAWKETTPADILKDHQELLKYFQTIETPQVLKPYEKFASQSESDLRRLIKALLNDEERDPVDKASAIELLLRGNSLKGDIWFGPDDAFLICGHTLATLKGDLEADKDAFYQRWTAIDDGFRSCKFCGEQINRDVFIAQDDFDENGNVIINYDVLDTGGAFKGDASVESFSNSLMELKHLFIMNNSGEIVLYLLLSLLQVKPSEGQLLPILQFIRDLTVLLKGNTKIAKPVKERAEGVLGIVGMTVLLLTHNPFLIPRRSFGSKVLKLSGFPRDTDDPDQAPVLSILISILRTTFEASPSTFKGSVATVMRAVIATPKDVRRDAIGFLKQTQRKFEAQYIAAKERYATPLESDTVSMISLPVVRRDKNTFKPGEKIGEDEKMADCVVDGPKSYITARLPPNVVQEPMIFAKARPSRFAEEIKSEYDPHPRIPFTDTEIRRRAGLGFPKGLKLEKIETFIRTETDGTALLALLNRVLDILSLEGFPIKRVAEHRASAVYLKTSLTRDAARGLLYELFHEVSDNKNKAGLTSALSLASQRDLAFNMILTTKEQASRQDSDLRTRERETFKLRMRNMDDTQREVTKMLLDIGIAPYIITNEDREIFAREYKLPDPEAEYNAAAGEVDIDRPEEGYNAQRDLDEDGAAPVADNGHELPVDGGDYGERRNEPADRDYERQYWTNLDEGDGV
jgi:hypothetical protein